MKQPLLLLVLLCVAACAPLAAGVRAEASKHAREHKRSVQHSPYPPFPFPLPQAWPPVGAKPPGQGMNSIIPPIAAFNRFAEAQRSEPLGQTNAVGDDTDRDFVRSIYNLLSRSRDANVADNSVLEKQKQETEKKQQELNRRAEILKSRAAMLTRLQYCLEKDASTDKSPPPHPPVPPEGDNLNNRTAEMKHLAQKLATLEQQLAIRKKQLDDMAHDLANRENNINKRLVDLQDQEKRILGLKNDANACNCPPPCPPDHNDHNDTAPLPEAEKCSPPSQCSQRDEDFPKIEKCVGPVVGYARAQHVRCWQACNRSPKCFRKCLQNMGKASATLSRFQQRLPQAAAGAAGAGAAGEESMTERDAMTMEGGAEDDAMMEESSVGEMPAVPTVPVDDHERASVSMAKAAAAPAAVTFPSAATKLTHATSPSFRSSPWLAADAAKGKCPGRCEIYQRCDLCVADANCGWCSTTQKCSEVNEGKAQCDEADYSIMYCREHKCEQHKYCSSCMADPKCGMCHSSSKCSMGGITGPSQGTCNVWSYASGLRFLSLNIYGRDMTNCTARGQIIFQMLEHANADFVMLQEVEDWFLELLSRQKWAANYHMSDFGSGHAPGGLLILSKVPLASVAYYEKTSPGQVEVDQRGRLLVVHPKMGNNKFAVATTTLDWRSGDNRADSMEFIFSVLNTTRDVVLAGDFNFDQNAQPETSQLPWNFEDVWQSLRPQHVGYTWDPTTNPYAHKSDPNSRPSRVDRMLVKAGFWEARKIQKVGSPYASPHYGLLAQLELFGAYC